MTELPRITLIGYASEISVAPGERIRFMVSEEGDAKQYHAGLMRMHSLDADPEGCGLLEKPVPAPFTGLYDARRQAIRAGSCVSFDRADWIAGLGSFTAAAYVWPTLPGGWSQTILACWDDARGLGFRLELDAAGAASLRLGFADGSAASVSTGVALRPREWVLVAASYDAGSCRAEVWQAPVRSVPLIDVAAQAAVQVPAAPPVQESLPLAIGAHALRMHPQAGFGGCFNGKIDRPRLAGTALDAGATRLLADACGPEPLANSVLGSWDFALDGTTTRVVDRSAWRRHGRLVNLPTRGMTGHNWTGEVHDWQRAPEQYGAIHFHDDDLYDCGWDADFAWTVPADCPSGCYAVKLEDGNVPGYILFFVRPPRLGGGPRPRPRIAFLASTAHFMACANYRLTDRGALSEAVRGRVWMFGPEDILLHARPDFGNSTYDAHTDGSGVCYTSRLRPIMNMRPNTRLASLAGDGFVLALFRHAGIEYDVITDEDLHRDGLGVLAPYACLVTGGHPEYMSLAMLDALEAFLGRGGRLMYLGGNGFYWRIAFHRELPGVIEVRRGEDGNRPWAAEPGETVMSFTGEIGGIWRRLGRPPNRLVGVGYTAEGFDIAVPYRRSAASYDPRVRFIFEGIGDRPIGTAGLGFGGAAGQEIDRYDAALGSPPHALVVASSAGHTDNMMLVNEDLTATHLAVGGVENEMVRADMVFFETGHGGAVFSTGSISWVAALPCNGFANDVARITLNVLTRFADPAEFPRIGRRDAR